LSEDTLRHQTSGVLILVPSTVSTVKNRGTFGTRSPAPPKNTGRSIRTSHRLGLSTVVPSLFQAIPTSTSSRSS
jgi:hypothetical protein